MISLILLIFTLFSVTSYPMNGPILDDPIIIFPTPPPGDGNRSPSIVPISGYYDTLAGAIVISFSSPCGQVGLRFDNMTNGDYYETSVNGSGTVILPFSFSPGLWRITFSLADGSVLHGEFSV